MTISQRKGYAGEAAVHQYLKARGFFRAYRLKAQGVVDLGDIGGIDEVCLEIKNARIYAFPEWLRELAREKAAAKAVTGAVVVKPKGVGDTRVGQWWAVLPVEAYVDLLIEAGYGPYDEKKDTHGNSG